MDPKAGSTAVPVAQPQTKKASRPNPARRKASKAKVHDIQPDAESCSKTNAKARSPTKRQQCDAPTLNTVPSKAPKNVASSPAKPAATKRSATPAKISTPSEPRGRSSSAETDSTKKASGHSPSSLAMAPPAVVTGGLLGCAAGAAVILGAGLWKSFAGDNNAILTARTAKLCFDNLTEEVTTSLKAGTYNAPEALDMLRRTTLAYANTIPGGAPLVERSFREIDMVRKQRGAEVDKVLAEASQEVTKAGKQGADADELQAIVFRQMMRLSTFATNATQDVLARNPKLRPYRDGAVKALRRPPESKVPTVKVNMDIQHKMVRAA
ncbi:hypothetical protein Slin15195_G096820 [Septoria linicola]|uniref:Uncharacterized protein n=1 Tax=Septoria linicola TaxID=215465 RepID=A0A9Q9B004_9PEZI|nr:hypothetical protein Slin14017_G059910 [Septoria linicola]USW56363.1 hypothetical protein Slin15195_G096820 [Septoria linicola]